MDKKTFGIGVLSITALLLTIACMLPSRQAQGAFAVKDRDYQLITAPNQQGGDTLYVVDNRTGLMAIFMYNNNQGVMRPMQVRPVSMAFQK